MKKLPLLVIALGLAVSAAIIHAQVAAGNSYIQLQKDPAVGLFTLTISDPQGIKEFSLKPPGRARYAGELPGCPRTFRSQNISFVDPQDFTPAMDAVVIDCQGGQDTLKIAPPQDGVTFGERPAPPKMEFTGPIPELGSCESEQSCRAYCEAPDNIGACLAFAEKNDLLSEEELAKARKFQQVAEEGGPGGCRSEAECASYCEDPAHLAECLAFAEDNDLLGAEELALAKKMLPLIEAGQTPGGCKSKAECEAFCSKKANLEQCLAFAEANGILPPEELAEAKKFLPLIKAGETPGGCASKDECEAYCSAEGHFNECLAFGEKTGYITKEEAEAIRKAGGKGPGGCRSREQCEAFCNDPAHLEECIDFGLKAGLIKPEEAELARKVGGQGPGGCRSEAACRAYCEDSGHTEECIEFGLKAGVIKPEEADIIRKAGGVFPGGCRSIDECFAYCSQKEHAEECAAFAAQVGIEIPEGGGVTFPSGGFQPPSPAPAPTGTGTSGFKPCRSDSECRSYCSSNPTSCGEFWGIGMPNGPGALPGSAVSLPPGAAVVTVRPSETGGYLFRFMSQRGMNDFFILPVKDYLASARRQAVGGGIYCASTFQDIVKTFSADSFPVRVTIGLCGGGKTLGFTVTPGKDVYITEEQGFSVPAYTSNSEVESCIVSAPDGRAMLSDWQERRNLTLETREIVRMCVLRNQGVGNPFEAAAAAPVPAVQTAPSTQQIPEFKVDCSLFSSAPSCSFVGSSDSQAYQLCKQCFPDR